jgi:hypothetical protein
MTVRSSYILQILRLLTMRFPTTLTILLPAAFPIHLVRLTHSDSQTTSDILMPLQSVMVSVNFDTPARAESNYQLTASRCVDNINYSAASAYLAVEY